MNNWQELTTARNGYIRNLAAENKRIKTLSEEQHDMIGDICSMRHELHMGGNALANPEHSDNGKISSYLYCSSTDGDGLIMDTAKATGIDGLDIYFCDVLELADIDGIDGEEDGDPDAVQTNSAVLRRVNDTVEEWLASIDREHGTSYCPTGGQRI